MQDIQNAQASTNGKKYRIATSQDVTLGWEHLALSSRSFFPVIEQCPENVRNQYMILYNVFRQFDSIEDCSSDFDLRISLLDIAYNYMVKDVDISPVFSELNGLKESEMNLLRSQLILSRLTREFFPVRTDARKSFREQLENMKDGMIEFLKRAKDGIHVQTIEDLNEYCDYVAGTVGKVLTDIINDTLDLNKNDEMYPLAIKFGRGLQKTNIVLDVAEDEEAGRLYMPQDIFRTYYDYYIKNSLFSLNNQNVINVARMNTLNTVILDAAKDLESAFDYTLYVPTTTIDYEKHWNFYLLPTLTAFESLKLAYGNGQVLKERVRVSKIENQKIQAFLSEVYQSKNKKAALMKVKKHYSEHFDFLAARYEPLEILVNYSTQNDPEQAISENPEGIKQTA